MSSIEQMREIADREAQKNVPRIGEPCEHYSGCSQESKFAEGYWYPKAGGCVMCEEHVHIGRGDRVIPDHPNYPTGWGTTE